MTQDTMFQNLYIVYFKQQSRIVKYNTFFKDETFRFMVKHQHHAHSFKLTKRALLQCGPLKTKTHFCVVTAFASPLEIGQFECT